MKNPADYRGYTQQARDDRRKKLSCKPELDELRMEFQCKCGMQLEVMGSDLVPNTSKRFFIVLRPCPACFCPIHYCAGEARKCECGREVK